MMIELTKIYYGEYIVQHTNGADLGTFSLNMDGDFYWWPPKNIQGCFSERILAELSNRLEDFNSLALEDLDEIKT